MNEEILTVPVSWPRTFGVEMLQGEGIDRFTNYLRDHAVWMDRDEAEVDENHKQIIPYVVLTVQSSHTDYEMEILGAERLAGGNEGRLHNRITLGFGGHVKKETGDPLEDFNRSVNRELTEELGLEPDEETDWSRSVSAVLHDDSDEVGRVHMGAAILYQCDYGEGLINIYSREPEKLRTFWSSLSLIDEVEDRLEGWAKLVRRALSASVASA